MEEGEYVWGIKFLKKGERKVILVKDGIEKGEFLFKMCECY